MTGTPAQTGSAPDYGLDAPAVVRNLLLVAAAGFILSALIWLRIIPAAVTWHLRSGGDVRLGLMGLGIGPALGCGGAAMAMVWGSKIGKVRRREHLLDAVPWTGAEQVLDVGCGRGLMLIGAAKRLRTGRAVGIDLWRAEDLSGNRPAATLANGQIEGVSDRIRVETADMRQLPFPDQSFDRVLSCAAIHNLAEANDRAAAIREIARVLRPGGFAIIDDIRHLADYNATFRQACCSPIRRLDSPGIAALWTILTFGSLQPGAWLIQRVA